MPAWRIQAVDLFDDLRQRAYMGWPLRRPVETRVVSVPRFLHRAGMNSDGTARCVFQGEIVSDGVDAHRVRQQTRHSCALADRGIQRRPIVMADPDLRTHRKSLRGSWLESEVGRAAVRRRAAIWDDAIAR